MTGGFGEEHDARRRFEVGVRDYFDWPRVGRGGYIWKQITAKQKGRVIMSLMTQNLDGGPGSATDRLSQYRPKFVCHKILGLGTRTAVVPNLTP